MKPFLCVFLCILVTPLVFAKEATLPLLAVREGIDGFEGSVATLKLEIRPGNGNVFFDTYPLTKFDTQVTTRYAKEIACYYTNVDCNNLDFFYTITSESSIVGGPSAGSAASALTIALLMDWSIKKDVAVSGTINSGGLIGPVGGLSAKIDAADQLHLKTVIIPAGLHIRDDNSTSKVPIDLIEYGKTKNITVVPVDTIFEVVYAITGNKLPHETSNITINPDYQQVMQSLAEDLCNRSDELQKRSVPVANATSDSDFYISYAGNLTRLGKEAFSQKLYYASASYCFGANVRLSYAALRDQHPTISDVKKKLASLAQKINASNNIVDHLPKKTITDLQSYMVVKERLEEASELYHSAYLEAYNSTNHSIDASLVDLAYAIERLYSASSWSTFFGTPGREFDLNQQYLRISCSEKIAEAQERIQYVKLFLPMGFENTDYLLEQATGNLNTNDYALCLYRASKAKAEANVILSTLGYEKDELPRVVQNKLSAARDTILREQQRGVFPILGYSFYEYASSLEKDNPLSALLYSEYALELSSMNLYFREKKHPLAIDFSSSALIFLAAGILFGFVIGIFTGRHSGKKSLEHSQKSSKSTYTSRKSSKHSALIPPPPDDEGENEGNK